MHQKASAGPKLEPSPFELSGCCIGVEARGGESKGKSLPLARMLRREWADKGWRWREMEGGRRVRERADKMPHATTRHGDRRWSRTGAQDQEGARRRPGCEGTMEERCESSEGSRVFIPRQSGGSADLPEGAGPNPIRPHHGRSWKGPPFSRPPVYKIKYL